MARFVYDEDKVNESLETLKNATKQVSETAQGFSSALSEIANASKGYLWIDTATLPEMPVQVTKTIEEIMQLITAKQTAIEEYNASPWYEKIFGSAGMILTKLGEGIGTAGEQLLDGAATIVGFGVGLFSKDMQSSISQFIEKDHVGDFFYEDSPFHFLCVISASKIALLNKVTYFYRINRKGATTNRKNNETLKVFIHMKYVYDWLEKEKLLKTYKTILLKKSLSCIALALVMVGSVRN